MTNEEIMVALAMSGALCERCVGPWGAARIDEYRGPGTAHVWDIYASDGATLVTLPDTVDGPAFVAWVNRHAPASVVLSASGDLIVDSAPAREPIDAPGPRADDLMPPWSLATPVSIDARDTLRASGWSERDGKWWREGVYVEARGGRVDIRGSMTPAELRAFAALAEVTP